MVEDLDLGLELAGRSCIGLNLLLEIVLLDELLFRAILMLFAQKLDL